MSAVPVATAAFAALFCAAVYLGRLTVVDGTSLSLVWPAAGVAALWFCLRRDGSRRWLDWSALVLGTVAVNALTGAPALLVAGSVAANVVQVAVLRHLFGRWCPELRGGGGTEPLTGVPHLARLLAAAVLATAAGAAVGPTASALVTGHWSWLTAAVWMTRNTVSVLLVVVVGLRLAHLLAVRRERGGSLPFQRPRGWRAVELAALVGASGALYALVFASSRGVPLAFVTLALTVWVALRFDTTVVAVHSLLAGVAAVLLTLDGHGPFAAVASDAHRALVVQAFAGVLTVIGLTLALGRDEREVLLARVRAQAAEAESRDTFTSAVLASTDAGIVVVDPDGHLVLLNDTARAWHGLEADARLEPSEHAGAYDLYGPDGTTPLPPHKVPVHRVLREEFVQGLEVVIARPGRRPRRVTCSGRAMRTADGTCLGAVVVMHDVTAERAREQALVAAHVELAERTQELADRGEELERSNTELEQFAGIASHDLSSPLAVVSGYLEMLGEVHGEAIGEEGRGWVETARRGVARMTELMDSLLSYSQTGGTGRRELADLGEVARLAVHDLDAAVRAAGASVDVPADLPRVYCDPVLLRQLLQNLVGNAVKYRDPHRPCAVGVTAAPDGAGGWEVAVVDNGTGIPAEHRERVFEMYAQVDPSARTGHGIGLATCQRIVARHGGRIRAEETPGGGTTVRFTLPQRPAPAADRQEVPGSTTAAACR